MNLRKRPQERVLWAFFSEAESHFAPRISIISSVESPRVNAAFYSAEQPGMDFDDCTSTACRAKARCEPRAFAWLIALIALTLVASLYSPTGWLGSDDAGYLAAAEHVLHGEAIQRVHHHYARMAVIVPVAASVALLGSTPTAVWLPSLIASLLCVVLVAWTGRMLWGWREGLLAALIVSTLPYFRVLSTAGFPDAHVCAWTAGSLALAIRGLRLANGSRTRSLLLASGFCAAIATLTKILTAPLVLAIVLLVLQDAKRSRHERLRLTGAFCLGGVIGILLEAAFFKWAAGDLLFNYHAHLAALEGVPALGLSGTLANGSTWDLVLDRLAMMFNPLVSGWGTLGIGFWIASVASLCFRSTRWLGAWLIGTYVLLSICPTGIKNGSVRLNPVFHGRHLLPLCIPFALCVAYFVGRGAKIKFSVAAKGAFPVAVACVMGLALRDRHHLNGFVNRPTSRVGIAIVQLIEAGALPDDDAPIFMTPSTYWRYRVLFPERLRRRLAVSADPGAPTWWTATTDDMASRTRPLPPPSDAYLIATPRQLQGLPEQWDYGVSLPRELIKAWQNVSPRAVIARFPDRTIRRIDADSKDRAGLVMLLGREDIRRQAVAVSHP